MQPYFIPYAGYFRLFAAADVVVMFDCVQFPRRGWVHRNRLALQNGELDWLTLPLQKAPYNARIADLRFARDAAPRLRDAMRRFPVLTKPAIRDEELLSRLQSVAASDVTEYLIQSLGTICGRLGFNSPVLRSSSMNISSELRGQDRVIEIAHRLGATRYINPPGGRALYEPSTFRKAGMELFFLTPFAGDSSSILARILSEPIARIRKDITSQCELVA